jgi:hypothetical protein
MKTLRAALAGLLSLLSIASAFAQAPPNLPAQHLWGRLGNPGDTGPSQAIPFSTLGISVNAVNARTSNYTVAPLDCGNLIQAGTGSTGKITITLPSVSGFAPTCSVIVTNGDTARGKILSGFPAGTPNVLFPLQSITVKIVNGAWAVIVKPGRWKLPGPTTIYVDNTGSNTVNDGLAPGSAGAFASVLGAMDTIFGLIDLNNQTVTVQNASGQNLTDITIFGQFTGSGVFIFDGGGATLSPSSNPAALGIQVNTSGQITSAGTAPNILLIQNMTITCSSGHSGLAVSAGYVSLNGGSGAGGNITFGSCTGGSQIDADGTGARIFNLGNYTISGGANIHLQQIAGGLIDFNNNGNTVTLTGTPAFSGEFALAEWGGGCMVIQNAWSGSATGKQYYATGNGCILNSTGSSLPGNVAGTTDTGGYYSPFTKPAYSLYTANSAGTSADFQNSAVVLGGADLQPAISNKVSVGSTTTTTEVITGQDTTHNLEMFWSPNATPGNATSGLLTAGYLNPVAIDASAVTINGASGGATTINNGGVAPTGTGAYVRATSPTLVTPALGTPSSGTLTNATGLPISGVSGLGTGVPAALGDNVNTNGGFPTYSFGPWTPAITTTGTAGTPAYTTQIGSYEIIGRQVTARFSITLSGWTGSPTGNVSVSGLPVASANTASDVGDCFITGYAVTGLASTNYGIHGQVAPNTTAAALTQNGNTSASLITAAQFGVTGSITGVCNYHT